MNDVLTDNEKAATFIGWRKGIACTGQCVAGTNSPHFDDVHPWRCPDMSDPRNYMKALEEVFVHKFSVTTLSTSNDGSLRWVELTSDDYRPIILISHAPTVGEAMIKVLVALYDAEHK